MKLIFLKSFAAVCSYWKSISFINCLFLSLLSCYNCRIHMCLWVNFFCWTIFSWLVLSGICNLLWQIGGGSLRIHKREVQEKVLATVGVSPKQVCCQAIIFLFLTFNWFKLDKVSKLPAEKAGFCIMDYFAV